MSRKPLKAVKNNAGGYDLLTERDAGNEIRILTGKENPSSEYWRRLRHLADDVLWELESILQTIKKKN